MFIFVIKIIPARIKMKIISVAIVFKNACLRFGFFQTHFAYAVIPEKANKFKTMNNV